MAAPTVGRRYPDGSYDVTLRLDADEIDGLAEYIPSWDRFAAELAALSTDIRRRELSYRSEVC